jgi:hypothetical protein
VAPAAVVLLGPLLLLPTAFPGCVVLGVGGVDHCVLSSGKSLRGRWWGRWSSRSVRDKL